MARTPGGVAEREEVEVLRVTQLLAKRVRESGLPVREVERRIGWGQGTLHTILSGGVSLRFAHVVAVAEGCGFSLGEFYMDLAKGAPGNRSPGERGEKPPVSPDLEKQIREVARKLFEEMERAKAKKKPRKGESRR